MLIGTDHTGQLVAYAGSPGKPTLRADKDAWQPLNLPDQAQNVETIAASPADPDSLYALTSGAWPPTPVPVRLYRNRDSGSSWRLRLARTGSAGSLA